MRNALALWCSQKASQDKNFFLISGDAGLGVWDEYQKAYPSQYLNPGINEALCVGMAAGLALCQRRVVYYNIAPFVIMRPYEQVRNDICYQELPVILVGTGSGLTYMPSGMTHYAIEDLALALSLPNLNIFSPCDRLEVEACVEYAYQSSLPSYIRIPKAGEMLWHKSAVNLSLPQILCTQERKLLLITHSAIIQEVMEAAKVLEANVLSYPFINQQNPSIFEYIANFKEIVVIEEHFGYGGLGSFLRHQLSNKLGQKIHICALENAYVHCIGTQAQARKLFGLDAAGIIEFVRRNCGLVA